MPLQATSGAASYDGFGGGAVAAVPNYIEDVFSTYLYTGNGSTQTITNGIDLSTKGGLVWIKDRTDTPFHVLTDTTRGVNSQLYTNSTADANSNISGVTAFNSNGFNIGNWTFVNTASDNLVSWTFREQPKFFDVVTYTGTGSNRTIAHSLGSVPACIIVKRTDSAANWAVYHRSLANTQYLVLNTTAAAATGATWWNSTTPTSSVFSVGTDASVNASGGTYVAYLFAHDAGGFGLTGSDNVITCGSFVSDASGGFNVSLGWEPQWVMQKVAIGASNQDWKITDILRGMTASPNNTEILRANSSAAASSGQSIPQITSTGFFNTSGGTTASATHIYIAIRRGPMKVPTTGTSVFQPIQYASNNTDNRLITTGIVTDAVFSRYKDAITSRGTTVGTRLTGNGFLGTTSSAAENTGANAFDTPTVGYGNGFSTMTGFGVGTNATALLNFGTIYNAIAYGFKRAPSFFDVVAGKYFGGNLAHNLGVVPELVIAKQRDGANDWYVWTTGFTTSQFLFLNSTSAISSALVWNTMTSTEIGLQNLLPSNTGIYYLFASAAGVSKVGSYTGTGALQTINCGFAAGARFVLIKRTDSTGDWYVWDVTRGIIAGNDPYLLLNSTAAEVTNTDYIDPSATGFEISSTAPAAINANGGTYIFLAIA